MSKAENIGGEAWLRIATIIVAGEFILTGSAVLAVGYRALPPVSGYIPLFFGALLLPAFLLLFIQVAKLGGEPSPFRTLCVGAYEDRYRLAVIALGIALALLQMAALTWLKPTLPMFGGFWADPLLADVEKSLLGADAWRWAHTVFGPLNVWIDYIYHLWFPAVIVTFFAVLLSRNSARPQVAVAYFLTVALAMVTQFMLPSAGPIFWERAGFGDRFAEMVAQLPPLSRKGSDFLWIIHSVRESWPGIGISAWPSVHVALTTWVMIAAARLFRPLLLVAILWWGAIFLGSVYLGWHYLLDSIAGALIAVIAYYAAGLILRSMVQPSGSGGKQLGSQPDLAA